jgi:hypothetical protein
MKVPNGYNSRVKKGVEFKSQYQIREIKFYSAI